MPYAFTQGSLKDIDPSGFCPGTRGPKPRETWLLSSELLSGERHLKPTVWCCRLTPVNHRRCPTPPGAIPRHQPPELLWGSRGAACVTQQELCPSPAHFTPTPSNSPAHSNVRPPDLGGALTMLCAQKGILKYCHKCLRRHPGLSSSGRSSSGCWFKTALISG